MSDAHKGGTGTSTEPEEDDDDFSPISRYQEWREGLKSRPQVDRLYRIGVAVLGAAVIITGIVLLPLPGPGWVIIFIGLAILATEFEWAKRLEKFARRNVKKWTDWLGRQGWPVRILVGLATFLFVAAVIYGVFYVMGLPGWTPDALLQYLPGLSK